MITKYSRGFIENMVKDKVAQPETLRNYDIITDHKRGLSYSQLAIKYNLSRMQIIRILKK